MKRLLAILLGTFVALLFAVANSHHVEISLIFGAPVRMRMIFVIAGAFVAGTLSTIIFQGWVAARKQREEQLRKKRRAAMRAHPDDDRGDLLEVDD
jgi:uncharacterized integral membrane protein